MRVDSFVAATSVSWFGLWVHELHRMPRLLGLTPDGDMFMLVIAAGLVYWWVRTHGTAPVAGLFAYAAINLVGGSLTVLPLGWLPFQPQQTWSHYAVHAVYALTQLPLLFMSAAALPRRGYTAAR